MHEWKKALLQLYGEAELEMVPKESTCSRCIRDDIVKVVEMSGQHRCRLIIGEPSDDCEVTLGLVERRQHQCGHV